jgi:hypothetical protein
LKALKPNWLNPKKPNLFGKKLTMRGELNLNVRPANIVFERNESAILIREEANVFEPNREPATLEFTNGEFTTEELTKARLPMREPVRLANTRECETTEVAALGVVSQKI